MSELQLQPHGTACVGILSELATLEESAENWGQIERQARSPVQHWIWVKACAEAFTEAARLHILAVGPPNRPVAFAPLVRSPGGFPRLRLLGVEELGEPMDFACADPAALAPLATAIARSPLPLWIERAPADSPTIAALARAYRWRALVHIAPAQGYPWISLDTNWTDPEARFDARRRSDFRRALRSADRLGGMHCEVFAPRPTELKRLLDEAFEVEAAGWKGRHGSAVKCDPLRASFYARYTSYAAERGILRIGLLRIGATPAAMQLAVETAGSFWLLKIGYAEQFARCSPGLLLMLHTLRYAAERGLHSYEFLGVREPWTDRWTRAIRPAVSLRAYPLRAAALTTLAADCVRSIAARWRSRLEPGS